MNKVQHLMKTNELVPCKKKEKEVQLTSADFKGICGFCHKKAGHKCKDCPECEKKSTKKKFTGCGKTGHLDSDC